ncbi:hypothetical protein BB560_004683 [Smittium megazygosporum]|uniref:Efficient mitochondria targeting-associated protein 19 n=1 Tax=Smittium megazygosporum TaxID=133381 RepID=A0A2T9Z8J9_9FUNG|nr:hypothetical protein BB560_005553 [Smittium megazygosporum]PVV00919.1 hypothetical protein BB560_004683 [Smittium megazygosporum]
MTLYDTVVSTYSLIHLISLSVTDLVPITPDRFLFAFQKTLNSILVNTYKDLLMDPKATGLAWFHGLLASEAVIQTPLLIMILLQKNTKITCLSKYKDLIHLVYGCHVATTMIPTLSHLIFGTDLQSNEILVLLSMYLPFALIPAWMVIKNVHNIMLVLDKSTIKKTI